MKNHSSLTYYFKKPTLNAHQACWISFLREFEFEIKHMKGKDNRVAYALSRKLNFVYEIMFSEVEIEAAKKYFEYQFLWQQAQNSTNIK